MCSSRGRGQVVIFDFDGTIVSGDSFGMFALHARGLMRYWAALLRNFGRLAAWKLGLADPSSVKEHLFSSLYAGMAVGELEEYGRSFSTVVERNLCGRIDAMLRSHIAAGDKVYIVSASPGLWIRPWAATRGGVTVVATEAGVSAEGIITGRFATANCRGDEKLRRIMSACPDLREHRVKVVTDNDSDAPLMDIADEVVFVGK